MSAPVTGLRQVLTVAGVELKQYVRDRSNIFFVLIFPLLLVALIGLQFGDGASAGRVAVVGTSGELTERLVDELEDRDVVVSGPDWDGALRNLARGRLDAAVRVDDAAQQAYENGEPLTLDLVRGSSPQAPLADQEVRAAVDAVRAGTAQQAALVAAGVDADEAAAALASARSRLSAPEVVLTNDDEVGQQFDGMGQYDFGAAGQLLLFVFLTTNAGSTTLIQARRLGVVRRMLSAPMTTTQLVAGFTLGRWVFGLFQGVYIMAASSLLFGVQWGNLALALLVLAVFALVAAGAGMLVGTWLESEGAAVGVGVGLGLVLAALGGSMFPLELFGDTMRTVAYAVPHSWGYEAFAELQRRDGGLVDIAAELGVLAAMAAVVLVAGAWSLRRSLARAM